MELTKKQKTTKYFCYCLIILLVDLLQNTHGLLPEIFGARCFLLLPVAVILAVGEDFFAGALIGLLSGLLWDLSSATHLGFNCIFLAVVCLFVSVLASNITRDTFITNMAFSLVVIILYCFIYWLCFIIIKGVDGGGLTLFSFYIPCGIYTMAASPIAWLLLRPAKLKLNHTSKQLF